MSRGYDAAERRTLQALLRAGEPLKCPACGSDVVQRPVERPPGVSYVRHRVLVICTGCGKSAGLETRLYES